MTEAPTFSDYISNVKEIARSNRFLFGLTGPFSATLPPNLKYHVKTATIPKLEVNGPELKYRGTKINLRGDISKDPLQVTFYADTEWKMRTFFESWVRALIEFDSLTNKRSSMKTTRFGNDISISQYSGEMNSPIVTYKYFDVAPYEISEMGLDHSTADGLLEFSITFHYSFWKTSKTTIAGNAFQGL